jgi:pheromone shutdown protein TraB
MMKIRGNIILLGTSHVSKKSTLQIKQVIETYKPEVVGIELDYARFKSLMSNSKNKPNPKFTRLVKEFGLSGALFALLAGSFQNKIGKKMNIEPGIDMKTAYKISREHKIPTALIDLNIKHTMRKLSNLSFSKKLSMFSSLIFKSFKKKYRNQFKFDINKGVPDEKILLELLNIVKKEVPIFYNILIEDRNIFMVKKILALRERHGEGYILAVVGAGHVDGMYKLLEKQIKETSHTTVDRKFKVNLS